METESDAARPELSEGEQLQLYCRDLRDAFLLKDVSTFSRIAAEWHGVAAQVVFDPALALHPTAFKLVVQGGCATFGFSTVEVPEAVTVMIVERWFAMLPFIKKLIGRTGEQTIEVILNLNDEGVDEGLAFCDARPNFTLIPDAVFVGMKGYAHVRDQYASRQVAWNDKADVVFWRGASTGRPVGERRELQRVTLCRLCRANASGLYDVGLSHLADFHANEPDGSDIRSLMSDPVQWYEFDRYKYHIDIDGHTNSWPGLMFKLHSGGLVFKVASAGGYRQWYYDRLLPWENYVPVRADMSDLFDLIEHFRHNDEAARRIAEAGRQLALSMGFEAEMDVGVRAIIGRSARQEYLAQRTITARA